MSKSKLSRKRNRINEIKIGGKRDYRRHRRSRYVGKTRTDVKKKDRRKKPERIPHKCEITSPWKEYGASLHRLSKIHRFLALSWEKGKLYRTKSDGFFLQHVSLSTHHLLILCFFSFFFSQSLPSFLTVRGYFQIKIISDRQSVGQTDRPTDDHRDDQTLL